MLAIPRTSINSPGGQGNNMNYYNTGKSKYLLSRAYSLLPPLELASCTTIECHLLPALSLDCLRTLWEKAW